MWQKSDIDTVRTTVLEIISTYPISKSGHSFLTLKNGKRVFFRIFLKKYGIQWGVCKYTDSDIIRRMRLMEFLDYLTKNYDAEHEDDELVILKSHFPI